MIEAVCVGALADGLRLARLAVKFADLVGARVFVPLCEDECVDVTVLRADADWDDMSVPLYVPDGDPEIVASALASTETEADPENDTDDVTDSEIVGEVDTEGETVNARDVDAVAERDRVVVTVDDKTAELLRVSVDLIVGDTACIFDVEGTTLDEDDVHTLTVVDVVGESAIVTVDDSTDDTDGECVDDTENVALTEVETVSNGVPESDPTGFENVGDKVGDRVNVGDVE